jgi:hypothetical protein
MAIIAAARCALEQVDWSLSIRAACCTAQLDRAAVVAPVQCAALPCVRPLTLERSTASVIGRYPFRSVESANLCKPVH